MVKYAENHVTIRKGGFYYVILYAFHRGRKGTGKEYGHCLILKTGAEHETIKSVVSPELTEAEVQEKKRAWMEMTLSTIK